MSEFWLAGFCLFLQVSLIYTGYSSAVDLNNGPNTCTNRKFIQGHPRIKGPRSLDDRIAIVGAGPSGLHMAYELKKRGYSNIVVFEKRGEVGGKTYSRFYRNVWENFGTAVIGETYDRTVKLLETFNVGFEVLPQGESSTWLNNNNFVPTIQASPMPLPRLREASERYIALHRCYFDEYEGELMPRPSIDVLYKIRGTVDDFLERHNLTDARPIFYNALTFNAYGFLNETSAIYGLLLLTPATVLSLFKPEQGLFRLEGGWQNLCREMARRINVDIRLNVDILRIVRRKGVRIDYKNRISNELLTDNFDFLILSPSMNSLFDVVDFNVHELRIFTQLRHLYFVKSLINSMKPGKRSLAPIDLFPYKLEQAEYTVFRSYNSHQVENNVTGIDYQQGRRENTDPDGWMYESVLYSHTGKANPWDKQVDEYIQNQIYQHLRDFNKVNPRIVEQVKWNFYFPNYPPGVDSDTALWDIIDMQGRYNTWYIGASVSFDYIEGVIEYNHLLLRLFK